MIWNWAQNLPPVCMLFMVKPEEPGPRLSPPMQDHNQLKSHGTYCTYGIYCRSHCIVEAQSVLHWVSQMEVDISCLGVDETCCAVCAEVFLSPVVLCCIDCDLSFCNSCLEQFWIQHGTKECPLCFKESSGLPHKSCEAHGNRLILLCVADLEPVCSSCQTTGMHMNHRVYPIKEAFTDCKVRSLKMYSVLSLSAARHRGHA